MKDVLIKNGRLAVGVDIGTTKICAVVGEVSTDRQAEDRAFNIIGVGTAHSGGIKRGVVTNIENTVGSIREAVSGAETMAGVDIRAAHIGITGGHIGCLLSNGVIAVKDKEIGRRDIESVIEAAKAVAIPFDREILHVIPTGFTVNGQNGITDPMGMEGVRLETNVQIITGAATSVHNLTRSCQKAGLELLDLVFQPLASANAVLTQDERELGVAIIDIGGGTTDIAFFKDGNICHSAVLTIGGNNFTNDIAIGLRVPTQEAENLKKKYGCSMLSLVKENEEIEIGCSDTKLKKNIPRRYLVEVLQPRAEEVFTLIKEELVNSGFHKYMNSGVVLTGGSVQMEGMDVMAENILELPVRIGLPDRVDNVTDDIMDPSRATAVGLMLYGANDTEQGQSGGKVLTGARSRIKRWLGGVFR
jgi:cell division protein FtsA